MAFFNWFAGQLWGWPMMILIFSCGLVFSIRTGFFQLRHLGYILNNTLGKVLRREKNEGKGVLTPWQAVSTALAGTVGNGNIAGVATAIAIGGPGAVFWMWIVSIFGMMTKMVEVSLAVEYRMEDDEGNFYGGPMFYIEKGLGPKWKPLAMFFAVMMILGALGTAVWVQPHTMAMAMKAAFKVPPLLTATVAVIITGLVIIGGFKRIGQFCEKLVPVMVIFYIFFSLGIILVNITSLPRVFAMIFHGAFAPAPAVGGFAGSTILLTMRRGMSRGMFSNEAGMGSAPMVHATAITDHPCRQGLYGALEVFIDTMVMCTMTALVILIAAPDVWHSGLNGVDLTFSAFEQLYGHFGTAIVAIGVLLAALSTMIGYYLEYETSVVYVFGRKAIKFFRWIYLVPPFIAVSLSVEFVWTIVDISTGIEGIPNMIALLLLNGVFIKLYKDFLQKEGLAEGKSGKTVR